MELWINFEGISGRNPAKNSGYISAEPLEETLERYCILDHRHNSVYGLYRASDCIIIINFSWITDWPALWPVWQAPLLSESTSIYTWSWSWIPCANKANLAILSINYGQSILLKQFERKNYKINLWSVLWKTDYSISLSHLTEYVHLTMQFSSCSYSPYLSIETLGWKLWKFSYNSWKASPVPIGTPSHAQAAFFVQID